MLGKEYDKAFADAISTPAGEKMLVELMYNFEVLSPTMQLDAESAAQREAQRNVVLYIMHRAGIDSRAVQAAIVQASRLAIQSSQTPEPPINPEPEM